jgi:hypothetical protein
MQPLREVECWLLIGHVVLAKTARLTAVTVSGLTPRRGTATNQQSPITLTAHMKTEVMQHTDTCITTLHCQCRHARIKYITRIT